MPEIVTNPVGEQALSAITKLRDERGLPAVGNVLRRTCAAAGESACKQVCQLRLSNPEVYRANTDKACADSNVEGAIEKLGLEPSEVLIVGVTANEVGFGDQLDRYEEEGKLAANPGGWSELAGFNAFFARTSEVKALGRRLADCADINFEFTDSDGNTVIGFEHGTRTNMFGSSEFRFEREGRKVSFTEFALGQAVDHYGADSSSIRIRLSAAIQAHNFTKHFGGWEKLEEHVPGWFEDGFLKNVSNPNWKPGDKVIPEDRWEADTRGMILRDIKLAMKGFGIPEENLDVSNVLDPGDSNGEHSSHQYRGRFGDTRDLYVTFVNSHDK